MPSSLIRILAIAAIVVILIPTCMMVACTMDMDMGALFACDSIWLASDAESGILVNIIPVFVLLVAVIAAVIVRSNTESRSLGSIADTSPIRPPADPLVGRLIV